MSAKSDLAALYSLLDKPISEFVNSEVFKRLEQETDIICKIESFGLPEVKKLICCSSVLSDQEWAGKYSVAHQLYSVYDTLDVLSLLTQYVNKPDEFKTKILSCVDVSMLRKIRAFFDEVESKNAECEKEKKSLKRKINNAKKKSQDELAKENNSTKEITLEGASETETTDTVEPVNSESEKKTDNELRLENVEKQIKDISKFLKGYEKHLHLTQLYLNQLTDESAMNAQREKAYRAIEIIRPSKEELFLKRYISDGKLLKEDEDAFRDDQYLKQFLELFDRGSYRNLAFPVLAKLYSDNAVDMECEPITTFVDGHNNLLAEYLTNQYALSTEFLEDTDNRVFLEYAIKSTIAGDDEYTAWWNSINKSSDWKIILRIAEGIIDDSLLRIAVKLLRNVNSISMDAFMELLQSDQVEDIRISPSEFIIELIGQEVPERRELVRGYIRDADQNIRKLQRRVAVKEREINRHSQELFSALYQPLEQLEQLAINLRFTKGKIKSSLVAGQVINALAELRESLSSLGLATADDVEVWKEQSLVAYNPSKHRMTSIIGTAGEKVKLNTLGFVYIDDEGISKVRAAEVHVGEAFTKKTGTASEGKSHKQKLKEHLSDKSPSKKYGSLQIAKQSMQTKKGKRK